MVLNISPLFRDVYVFLEHIFISTRETDAVLNSSVENRPVVIYENPEKASVRRKNNIAIPNTYCVTSSTYDSIHDVHIFMLLENVSHAAFHGQRLV